MRLEDRSTAPWHLALAGFALTAALLLPAIVAAQTPAAPPAQTGAQERKPQTRPHGKRISVDPTTIRVGDGDTVDISWGASDNEIIRILGIDTPETRNPEHDLPYSQSFGEEAKAFARGAFAAATKVELLRADIIDPYGRTLGYLFLNDRNYSVLVVTARLAVESVTRYGDNGFPEEAKTVAAAAKAAGPVPFEPPADYRRRMRDLSRWMKEQGVHAAELSGAPPRPRWPQIRWGQPAGGCMLVRVMASGYFVAMGERHEEYASDRPPFRCDVVARSDPGICRLRAAALLRLDQSRELLVGGHRRRRYESRRNSRSREYDDRSATTSVCAARADSRATGSR